MEKTNKIENLIEGLSSLSEHELEEAKEILRKAGKNPEVLLSRAMQKLRVIQREVRSVATISERNNSDLPVQISYPVVAYVKENSIFQLSYELNKSKTILNAEEVYDAFVKNNPFEGDDVNMLNCDEGVRQLSFRKITRNLFSCINLKGGSISVSFMLQNNGINIPIDTNDVRSIIETKYIIIDSVWMPVGNESLDVAHLLLSKTDSSGKLDLRTAVEYYFHLAEFHYLRFTPDSISISDLTAGVSNESPGSHFAGELYDYQKDGFRWLQHCCLTRTGGILGDDMGLGKTAQIIAMIAWAMEQDIFSKFLIVVPGTLLENWKREFDFFAPRIKPFIHHGNNRTGSVKEFQNEKVIITSYSMIINDEFLFNRISWDVMVADEASLLKNPESERRISFKNIPSALKILMTGTPVENSLMDLWSLVDITNEGFLGTKSDFSNSFIRKDINETISGTDLQQLQNNVSLIMLRRKKEDVLTSLPEKIDIHHPLQMGNSESAVYDEAREEILASGNGPGVILGLIQELRKYTTHPLLSKENEIMKASLRELCSLSVKFTRTLEIVEEIKEQNEKVLIFTEYLNMIDTFSIVFTKHFKTPVYTIDGRVPVEQRQANIDEFSERKGFSIMVLNPRTAGMGLNITAANHVIHYTRQWNPALEEQATGRAYRNKQTKGVNVYYLYYINTIEEIIDERLRAKSRLSQNVITSYDDEYTMEDYIEALKKSPIKK